MDRERALAADGTTLEEADLELMERRFILSEEGRLVRSGLVRIAVGLEDIADIRADLASGLD